jgi:hypothetical protein
MRLGAVWRGSRAGGGSRAGDVEQAFELRQRFGAIQGGSNYIFRSVELAPQPLGAARAAMLSLLFRPCRVVVCMGPSDS